MCRDTASVETVIFEVIESDISLVAELNPNGT